MKTSELLTDFRVRYLFDPKPPYRIGDDFLLGALNEAQRQACTRGLLLYDETTPDLCSIALTAGQRIVSLGNLWTKIDRIRFVDIDTQATRLEAITQDALEDVVPDWRTGEGLPTSYVPNGYTIRLDRAPSLAGTMLEIAGWRLPLQSLRYDPEAAPDPIDDEPEIPVEYHDGLLLWVARCVALKADPDPFLDRKSAPDWEVQFTARFGPYVPAHVRLHQLRSTGRVTIVPAGNRRIARRGSW